MTSQPPAESPFGPERAGPLPEPKTARPVAELRQASYTTEEALETFESLLLTAASAPLTSNLLAHPLVLVQGAKALMGLAPDRPSWTLMAAALEFCDGLSWQPFERERLVADPEQLGLTVSVYDFEDALASGDAPAAIAQLGRIMMVSDSRQFLFDILLGMAARDPRRATALLPFVHSCQRAYNFVGHLNLGEFIIPALEAVASEPVVAQAQGEVAQGDTVTPWEVLDRLPAGPPGLLLLAAHAAQIMADEHVKGPALAGQLGRTLNALTAGLPQLGAIPMAEGSVNDLLAAAEAGEAERSAAIGRHLAQSGDRRWILEVLETASGEAAGDLSPQLLLWADGTRMLLRVAPEEHRGAVGEVVGGSLTEGLTSDA